ncbi:MAG: hypothetical protein WC728_12875 [Elusimicrobiota bacterium]
MAHKISNEPKGRGVLVTLSGLIKADEIYKLNEQLISHELFTRWRYQIWDFSGTERLELTPDDLRSFAIQDSQASRKNPGQKVALIGRPNSRNLGLASVFHIFEEAWDGYDSKTFFDLDTAREWARQ